MITRGTVLTSEELDVLTLGALQPSGKHLSNREISQRLNIPVSRVKSLVHQACVKLGANNRNQAILYALRRGELNLRELFSIDELAEIFSSLSPETLREIVVMLKPGLEYGHLSLEHTPFKRNEVIRTGTLTNRERDVLILASYGMTNQEMAERLCMSLNSISSFLFRAFKKLGASTKADAVLRALKKREIYMQDIFTDEGLLLLLAYLGAESIEKMAQILENNFKNESPIN